MLPTTTSDRADAVTTTTKSTQAEIVAEAQTITAEDRYYAQTENAALIRALKEVSGLQYGYCVKQARYRLEVIDYSGKKVQVIPSSEFMPFYEFNEFLRNFKHPEKA
jgi:ABC-type proline/glycine betaine transport system substrate-binding protein